MAMGDSKDIDPMMLAMMMSQSNMGGMNPMMLALMMGDGKDTSMRDMLMLSMMMGNQGHTCQCGKEHSKANSLPDMSTGTSAVTHPSCTSHS